MTGRAAQLLHSLPYCRPFKAALLQDKKTQVANLERLLMAFVCYSMWTLNLMFKEQQLQVPTLPIFSVLSFMLPILSEMFFLC